MRGQLARIALVCLAGGCAAIDPVIGDAKSCATRAFDIDASFERGAFAKCRALGQRTAILEIRPEDGATNPSPWYAFRLTPKKAVTATVRLAYSDAAHRYWPKVRHSDGAWMRIDEDAIKVADDGAMVTLNVRLGAEPVFVAAQPLDTMDAAIGRMEDMLGGVGFVRRALGESPDGRPLVAFEHAPPDANRLVVILARQHPPETTGSVAFEAFMQRLASCDPAATAFRARHAIIVAPLVNPDGFVRGHWRGNAAGVDVNRDWGPFKTPEAAAFGARILELAAHYRPVFFADFHSTRRNVIYAAPEGADPDGLADAFIRRLRERLGEAAPEIAPSRVAERTTAKSWSLEALEVAGFTYEVADEADLESTEMAAAEAATALLDVAALDAAGDQ